MIQMPLINPLRFSESSSEYNFDHNSEFCYFQKWQLGDVINLQFLSVESLSLKLQSLEDGLIKNEFISVEIENSLEDVDFTTQEFSISLDENITFGRYRFILESNENDSIFFSNSIEYQEEFERTILFKYRNTFNDFDAVFETGIEYYFRIEGTVNLFNPKLDSVIYVNQKKNHELLSATPYRYFTLFIGNGKGIPDWCLDLSNRILCVDSKSVDNLKFEITDGSELEVTRIDNYPLASASIEICEKYNPYSQVMEEGYYLADNEDYIIESNNSLNIIN